MKRVEIICNNSIFEDIEERFCAAKVAQKYTKLEDAHGIGRSGQKWGTGVWPEQNFIMVIYCDQEELNKIVEILSVLKEEFPNEGIKVYSTEAQKEL